MTMKRALLLAASTILILNGCAAMHGHSARSSNPYDNTLFYEKYLNPSASPLDAQIARTIQALRANPSSGTLHNDLGELLVAKGFPKDAEVEFERSVNADAHFYPGWYNLGLVRMSRGDTTGAHFAFARTVHYKPGHSAALFQLGMMEEQRHHVDDAVNYYAKAFAINHSLLDVRVNPRILDSKLVDLALIRMYPNEHARGSMQFQGAPPGYNAPAVPLAPAPSPAAPTPTPTVAPAPVPPGATTTAH